ncbi:ferrous iron transport protein B [Flammeovirga kamogawensis]|uniref:Ferrous iron transport protein B n=1 Tax=Flammeovirga kamogawensis TaxID=373891 RepID=A0ABX8H072_9BACT|nr:ferrous iron transport protein B [Flammeovirga kamogawensis]MBB6459440.1 ferrous iron transport protein B [Flammeovirga kamogawensis]QWG08993.1 ferrous iron transport protein B [Flammeovirga kamogawensis]TRX67284.1 ferrous iron transport protein B [Flammeovirga kamogawensis]
MNNDKLKIALLGNPNVGKSCIFNQLTGLRQKVGNFPGVTVDKKIGTAILSDNQKATIIDFPGTYSLYPTSSDERVVLNTFADPTSEDYPDVIIYIADITNLERHLLLLTQVKDLGLPIVLVLNMSDIAEKKGLVTDSDKLSKVLKVPIVTVNGRSGEGIDNLKTGILSVVDNNNIENIITYKPKQAEEVCIQEIKALNSSLSDYQASLWAHHFNELPFIDNSLKASIKSIVNKNDYADMRFQIDETLQRFNFITPLIQSAVKETLPKENFSLTDKIDAIVTHKYFGPLIFVAILLLVFQSIFSWASGPMDLIDEGMASLGEYLKAVLPEGWFTDLILDGVIAGLGGVLVFVPQITILFFLISLMEESGYMSRAVYMFDKIMMKFGMNGRSIIALISGGACAIPAVMSTRTIGNWKERMITIMVTPLISCSARIPVYAILVAFAVPDQTIGGIFNLQGLTFMGLYVLGVVATLLAGLVFKKILKADAPTFLAMELPSYKMPHWKNVALTVGEKVNTFVTEAGKVIIIVSIALWALATYGPGDNIEKAEVLAKEEAMNLNLNTTQTEDLVASKQLEASYVGILGKGIEPLFRPLGFDWKISIALVTSFAAREVFVGTMATIYSVGSSQEEIAPLRKQMAAAVNPTTGEHEFTRATAFSLMVFYVFAMQCMSTLAVVKRETKSWKWPAIQFAYMSALAYIGSLITYHIFL